jgi:hypothetical protein
LDIVRIPEYNWAVIGIVCPCGFIDTSNIIEVASFVRLYVGFIKEAFAPLKYTVVDKLVIETERAFKFTLVDDVQLHVK